MKIRNAIFTGSWVVVDVYALGFAGDLTAGRARAMVAAVVGLISLVIGGLALATTVTPVTLIPSIIFPPYDSRITQKRLDGCSNDRSAVQTVNSHTWASSDVLRP